MEATVEPLENNRVKLHIAVPETEFESAIDAAYRKIAREVRLPGFRPGKAPRKVLEARVGAEAGRQQALRDALPDYYVDAVTEHDVDVIAPPEFTITSGEEDGPVEFDAVVEIRPQVTIMGYDELRVTLPFKPVDDTMVDAEVNRVRDQFASLADSERPLALEDFATIDVTTTIDGEEVDGLSVQDYSYPVGSGMVVPELDENLRGVKTGEILEFDAVLPEQYGEQAGQTAHFRVFVKNTQEKNVPDLTDEWVDDNTEYDDVTAMREDVRRRVDLLTRAQANMQKRDAVLTEVAQLVPVPPPETLVDEELRNRLGDMQQRLQQQGLGLDQYVAATGQDPDTFISGIREQAAQAVLADLALRAVVAQEEIQVSDAELDEEIARLATRMGQKVEKVRRDLAKADMLEAVRSDLAKGNALQFLVDHATPVDEEGNEIDIALPERAEDPDGSPIEAPPHESSATSDDDTAAVSEPQQG
jgi:trigger factor